MGVKFEYGNLLEMKHVDAIIHQVNCLCTEAHGLSRQISIKFPWGDIYATRRSEGSNKNLAVVEDRGSPGTIQVLKSPNISMPNIVCFLSQWDCGKANHTYRSIPPYKDTRENRFTWFCKCLEQLDKLEDVKSVGIPYQIDCELAVGDWDTYFEAIKTCAERSHIEFLIVIPHFSNCNPQMYLHKK